RVSEPEAPAVQAAPPTPAPPASAYPAPVATQQTQAQSQASAPAQSGSNEPPADPQDIPAWEDEPVAIKADADLRADDSLSAQAADVPASPAASPGSAATDHAPSLPVPG